MKKEKESYHPTEAELSILQVLWRIEPATVREVYEALGPEKEVGYTTVLKQMQRLFDKAVLVREEEGKAHRYRTAVKETSVKRTLAQRLLRTAFRGSVLDMALHALGREAPSPEELEALEKLIQQKKKEEE